MLSVEIWKSEGTHTREEAKLGNEVGSVEAKLPLHLTGSSGLLMAPERHRSQAFLSVIG